MGWCSRCSDSLRAGQSGERVPVGARFSVLVQLALGPTQPPVQGVPVLFNGFKWPGPGVANPPNLAPRLNKQ